MKHTLLTLGTAALLMACTDSGAAEQPSSPTSIISSSDYAMTEQSLRSALNSRGLKLFTVVDHGEGARSIGSEIGESKLFIFGNPKAGTPLMEADRTMGLALPLKVLLYEENDEVRMIYDAPSDIGQRYGLSDQSERLAKMDGALSAITQEAAGQSPN